MYGSFSMGFKKPHCMEHDLAGYTDAMNNSQKPQPEDPDKKQSESNAADSYTGKAGGVYMEGSFYTNAYI